MNKHKNSVRTLAMAAAIGFAAATSSPIAFAQTTAAAAPVVNAKQAGTLTVHKYADPTSTQNPTGEKMTVNGGSALPGVGFTVYRIKDIDVTTNEGLAAAAGIKASDYIDASGAIIDSNKVEKITNPTEATGEFKTGTDGSFKVDINGLNQPKLGAYLVVETSPLDGYHPAAPFIAFVPMTKGDATNAGGGTEWNYDVHAYPKNYTLTDPVKTVVDADKNVSENIVYNIDTTIRQVEAGKQLSYYYVKDVIDKDRLDVKNATVTVKIGDTVLTEGLNNHYTVSKDVATGEILVRFRDAGLDLLKSGIKVTTTIDAKFIKLATGDDAQPFLSLENTASDIFPHDPSDDIADTEKPDTPPETPPETPENPSNTVKTYYGSVEFTKVDENKAGLKDAEFKIFRVKPEIDENGTVTKKATCDSLTADTIKGDGVKGWGLNPVTGKVESTNLFKSGADGKVSIDGLHVTDFADNAEVVENARPVYCLVETKSPSGYELLAKPIPFIFNATFEADDPATTEVDESTIRNYAIQLLSNTETKGQVVNLKDTTPNLPMTGGMGIGLLVGLGAAVVGAGMFFARRSAKN